MLRSQNLPRHRNFLMKTAVSAEGDNMANKTRVVQKSDTSSNTLESDVIRSIKVTDISALTVNSATLEKMIGVTDRRIRQLADEGVLIRAAKGRYKLMDSIRNYILSQKIRAEAASAETLEDELDLEEEKAIHERVKRYISELKLQTMKGELHKAEDVERVMTDMLVSIKTKLLSMPTKLAPILVSRNDIDFIRSAVNREVLDTLNELKAYNPKDFYGDEYVASDEGGDSYDE